LRRIEYSADRFGLLCCESVDAAISAIAVSTFHLVGRKIDLTAFAEQYREIASERSLQMGEWVTATPYATNRIAAMHRFLSDPKFAYWSAAFAAAKHEAVVHAPVTLKRKNYVGFFRRVAGYLIDLTLIEVLFPKAYINAQLAKQDDEAASGVAIAKKVVSSIGDDDDDAPARAATPAPSHPSPQPGQSAGADHSFAGGHVHTHFGGFDHLFNADFIQFAVLFAYVVVLVGLAGQTFGMMILGMRVVATTGRVSLGRAFWRYAVFLLTLPYSIFRIFGRIQPFEKWSGTRLVTGNTPRASSG
jgi:hypothetical protein